MKALISTGVFAIFFAGLSPAMAQMDHSMHGSPAAKKAPASVDALGEGTVKKVDKTKGTVTLSHGVLPNGMPPMTMAYRVKDRSWLDRLQAGQTIRFATDPADNDMTVTRIELVK
jgi:Cu/Ag efflux protein CusF